VLDDTTDEWQDSMKDLMDEVLQASSQTEAWQIFEEILEGERRQMLTVASEDGQPEEIDAYRKLREEAAPALATLKDTLEDATAVLALPGKYRRRLRTTSMIERLIEEVRRREKVIRIFPNIDSTWRPIGAVLAEKHEEWSTGRKYSTWPSSGSGRSRPTGLNLNLTIHPYDNQRWLPNRTSSSALLHKKSDLIPRPDRPSGCGADPARRPDTSSTDRRRCQRVPCLRRHRCAGCSGGGRGVVQHSGQFPGIQYANVQTLNFDYVVLQPSAPDADVDTSKVAN
jgi:hypothetical protein